jgi:hypothetical protein
MPLEADHVILDDLIEGVEPDPGHVGRRIVRERFALIRPDAGDGEHQTERHGQCYRSSVYHASLRVWPTCSHRRPSWMEDAVAHVGRERMSDGGRARVDGAEEVSFGVLRRPLDLGAGVLIFSTESGLIVIDLQSLPRPRPLDIDAGRRADDWGRSVPQNRVHIGEIVEHREIGHREAGIPPARPYLHGLFRDRRGPEHATIYEVVGLTGLIQIARVEFVDLR